MAELAEISEREIEDMFRDLGTSDSRRAAELAYVLAKRALDRRDFTWAKYWGDCSLLLFDKCPMETLEDCAARYVVVGGIALPSIIHQAVVKNRLAALYG